MSDLDTRLRSAGTSLRRAVEPLDPGVAPSTSGRGDRRPLFLAAAAVVVLVLALAAVALALRSDDDADVSTDPDGVPRLVLDEAVVGMPATGATDLPVASDEGGHAGIDVVLYDAPAPTRPGGSMDVLLVAFPVAEEGTTMELSDGEPVTVRGVPGRMTDEPLFGLSVGWQDDGGRSYVLATRDTGAREELLAMAEAGTISAEEFMPGPTGAAVDPPTQHAAVDDVDMWSGIPVPTSAVGHTVGYQSDDDIPRFVMLTTFAGSDAEAEIVRWMTGAQEPVEVRGHAGWTGTQEFTSGSSGSGSSDGSTQEETTTSTTRTLVWEEAPGVYVVMRGTGDGDGIGEAEMLSLADSLRPAGEAEWTALGDRADSAAEPDASAVVEGEYDGGNWAVYLDVDGALCAGINADSSGTSSCGSPGSPPGGAEILTDDDGTPIVVYGAIPADAVDVQVPNGASGVSTSQSNDGTTTVYAITFDGGPVPTEVVFVDAAGEEVGRVAAGSGPGTPTTIPGTVP